MGPSIFYKLRYFVLISAFCLFFQNSTYSNSSSTLPHAMLLDYIDKAVLGKLIRKKEFTYIENEKEKICAVELEFVVSESWKGGVESFIMLASTRNLKLVEGHEYFIFAMENKQRISRGDDLETFSCKGINITGANTKYQFTQIWAAQAIFPVTRKAGDLIEDWWIAIYDDPYIREELPPQNIVRYRYGEKVTNRMTPSAINMGDFLEYLFPIK